MSLSDVFEGNTRIQWHQYQRKFSHTLKFDAWFTLSVYVRDVANSFIIQFRSSGKRSKYRRPHRTDRRSMWLNHYNATIQLPREPVYTKHQRQCCDVTSNIALIKLLRFLNKPSGLHQKWFATLNWSDVTRASITDTWFKRVLTFIHNERMKVSLILLQLCIPLTASSARKNFSLVSRTHCIPDIIIFHLKTGENARYIEWGFYYFCGSMQGNETIPSNSELDTLLIYYQLVKLSLTYITTKIYATTVFTGSRLWGVSKEICVT